MAVALCRIGLCRLARHRRGAWRHNDRGVRIALNDGTVDVVLIVGAVARERGHGPVHLVQQRTGLGASSTSFAVSAAATISPVLASMPICSFLQERRVFVPCFSTSHSPAPQSFNPVLSTSRCTAGLSHMALALGLRRCSIGDIAGGSAYNPALRPSYGSVRRLLCRGCGPTTGQ